MPTNIPNRQKPARVSTFRKIIIAVTVIALIMLFRAFAAQAQGISNLNSPGSALEEQFMQHLEDMHKHRMQMINNPETRLGYYGYMHDRYHAPFYSHMNTMDGHNCCSGEECRPTETLMDAPPEFKVDGFDKMVYIDGDWYPIKMKDVQVSFDKQQIEDAKKSSLYQEFLQQTHVCARRMYLTDQIRSDKQRYHNALVSQSRGIHCVLEGGVRM